MTRTVTAAPCVLAPDLYEDPFEPCIHQRTAAETWDTEQVLVLVAKENRAAQT